MTVDLDSDSEKIKSITVAVESAITRVRTLLQSHAGDLEIASVSPEGDVTLEFRGTCIHCPAQAMTVGATILPAFDNVPGVRNVRVKSMNVSDAAVNRIRRMFQVTQPR